MASNRPLRVREIQAVGLAFDEAMEASVTRYVHSRDEQGAANPGIAHGSGTAAE